MEIYLDYYKLDDNTEDVITSVKSDLEVVGINMTISDKSGQPQASLSSDIVVFIEEALITTIIASGIYDALKNGVLKLWQSFKGKTIKFYTTTHIEIKQLDFALHIGTPNGYKLDFVMDTSWPEDVFMMAFDSALELATKLSKIDQSGNWLCLIFNKELCQWEQVSIDYFKQKSSSSRFEPIDPKQD